EQTAPQLERAAKPTDPQLAGLQNNRQAFGHQLPDHRNLSGPEAEPHRTGPIPVALGVIDDEAGIDEISSVERELAEFDRAPGIIPGIGVVNWLDSGKYRVHGVSSPSSGSCVIVSSRSVIVRRQASISPALCSMLAALTLMGPPSSPVRASAAGG